MDQLETKASSCSSSNCTSICATGAGTGASAAALGTRMASSSATAMAFVVLALEEVQGAVRAKGLGAVSRGDRLLIFRRCKPGDMVRTCKYGI